MGDKGKDGIDIPIKRSDLVMRDNTVSAVREQFIAELKKMDEEMAKFSSALTRLYTESSSLQVQIGTAKGSVVQQSPSKSQCNWDTLAKSPFVECDGKNKNLKLQFDVSQFDPSEVTVRIQNETLVISATHEEVRRSSTSFRQYYREFKFPKGIEPCAINTTLSKDGVLTVQAPLPEHPSAAGSGGGKPKCKTETSHDIRSK